jgi:hypothetical protein
MSECDSYSSSVLVVVSGETRIRHKAEEEDEMPRQRINVLWRTKQREIVIRKELSVANCYNRM